MRYMKFIPPPPKKKNKENVKIYPSLKFCYRRKKDFKKETSNKAFMNRLPFSVLLYMRVYQVGNTDSDV